MFVIMENLRFDDFGIEAEYYYFKCGQFFSLQHNYNNYTNGTNSTTNNTQYENTTTN